MVKEENDMSRKEQWDYAVSLLNGFGIDITNNTMTFSGNGYYLVIHSKQLCNCISIGRQHTKEDIFNIIQREIKIKLMKTR